MGFLGMGTVHGAARTPGDTATRVPPRPHPVDAGSLREIAARMPGLRQPRRCGTRVRTRTWAASTAAAGPRIGPAHGNRGAKGTAAGRLPAAVRCARRTQVWKARDTAAGTGSAATSSGGADDDRRRERAQGPSGDGPPDGRDIEPGPPAAPTGSRPSTPRRKTCCEDRAGRRATASRSGAAENLQASGTNESVRCRADGARTLDRPITTPLAQIAANLRCYPSTGASWRSPPPHAMYCTGRATRIAGARTGLTRCDRVGAHDGGGESRTPAGDFRRPRLASPLRAAGPARVTRCAGPA